MIFCYKHTDKQTLHHYIYIIIIIRSVDGCLCCTWEPPSGVGHHRGFSLSFNHQKNDRVLHSRTCRNQITGQRHIYTTTWPKQFAELSGSSPPPAIYYHRYACWWWRRIYRRQGLCFSIRMIIWIFCCDTLWWLCVFVLFQKSYFQRVRRQCCVIYRGPDDDDENKAVESTWRRFGAGEKPGKVFVRKHSRRPLYENILVMIMVGTMG